MKLVPVAPSGALAESDAGGSLESLAGLLQTQKELLHSQVDQLERLVVAQCRLTGVNPLAQEMAAGALSVNIGKKPRNLLNPKAANYLQSIFAMKDSFGKKETREISAHCGLTVTQVRDFFAGQRARVRKLVHLSREKAMRLESSKNVLLVASEQSLPVSQEACVNIGELQMASEPTEDSGNSMIQFAVKEMQLQPDIVHPLSVQNVEGVKNHEGAHQNTVQGESSIVSEDEKFVDNIFTLMRKEETFSGQVKLLEWLLQINNSAVLTWFVTRGGLTILATWLSQVAVEEQTSVLLIIFKVLCHIPLRKALPVHMSAILQTVNKLRFYRTTDISNRARVLLSRWSKLFVRSQAGKKPSGLVPNDAQKEMIVRQRISEILQEESWQSEFDISEGMLAITDNEEISRNPLPRKTEPKRALMLLPASCDELSKGHSPSVSSTKAKKRRKVLLVEPADCKTTVRSVRVARAVPASRARPLSADDIQKAKMRAAFMRDKYGEADISKSDDISQKMEGLKLPHSPDTSRIPRASGLPYLPNTRKVVGQNHSAPTPNNFSRGPERLTSSKPCSTQENLMEKLKRSQICWQTPPGVRIEPAWAVCTGDHSKERDVQTQRNRREQETFYSSPQDIPLNPKEPWDMEMDFDDSLTPEIPTEQPPDADLMEEDAPQHVEAAPAASSSGPPPLSNAPGAEPDLELLAVLLKNPELVFALTSGHGKSLPDDQTVALLDLLKRSGAGLEQLVNATANGPVGNPGQPEPEPEMTPASFPSPTPPADPAARANWRLEFPAFAKAPLLQPHLAGSRRATVVPNAAPQIPCAVVTPPVVANTRAPSPTTILSLPQLTVTINRPTQPHLAPVDPPPSSHHSVDSAYHNTVLSSRHQPLTNGPTVSPTLPLHEPFGYGRTTPTSQPMLPDLLPALPKLPPPPVARCEAFDSRVSSWPASAASVARPVRWAGQPSRNSDIPDPNLRHLTKQHNYNEHASPNRAFGRNMVPGPSQFDMRGPEGSPERPLQFRTGWDHRSVLPRPRNPYDRQDYHRSGGDRRRHGPSNDGRR